MQILITGGAGLLGTRLAKALLARGSLTDGNSATRTVSKVTLFDIVPAAGFDDPRVVSVVGDVASAADIAAVLTPQTDAVFHLAAVVSGQAEADFELGMRINLDATRMLLERARANGNRSKFIFTSSVAVFGGLLPARFHRRAGAAHADGVRATGRTEPGSIEFCQRHHPRTLERHRRRLSGCTGDGHVAGVTGGCDCQHDPRP